MQISLVHVLVLGLAAMRLSMLLANEDGPWDMIARLRHMAGVRYDEASQPYGTTMVANGILCVYCSSVWIGLFFTLAWLIWPDGAIVMAMPWAISGMAIALSRLISD